MPSKQTALVVGIISFLLLFPCLVPSISANSGNVSLTTAYKYSNTHYTTTIGWSNTIYMDVLYYGLGTDTHINFTDISLGASGNPSHFFGVASQNGNANITKIQTNYVRFAAVTQAAKTLNLTFYYSILPTQVEVGQPSNTTITQASYLTSYASFVAAAAPAVYDNAASSFLMVKSTNASPTIQFDFASTPSSSGGAPPTFFWLLLLPFILIAILLASKTRRV